MNIRKKFLKSKFFNFEGTDISWHNNQIFKFKGFSTHQYEESYLYKNDIFIGLTKEPLIFLNDLKLSQSKLTPDLLIFASRHRSKTARPAFLTHTTGNWSKTTDFGGDSQDLSRASALLQKAGFISLIEQNFLTNLSNFSLDIEVTHHGPTVLEKPLVFMELGSSKLEWTIDDAGELLAKSIINTVLKFLEFKEGNNQKIGLGFGGTHYAPNFNRLIKNNNVAISFICPKYYIQELNIELITKMIENTLENVDYFIIDWKGTNSADKKHLIPLLEEFNIPIKKTKEF